MRAKIVEHYMNLRNPKAVFMVAVGKGRRKTFERFCYFAGLHVPEVDVVPHFDEKEEGCGTSRAYLFHKLKNKYDILVSLDDDIELSKGWYQKVIAAYKKFPKTNMFTTKIMQNDSVYSSGANIRIDGNILTMVHNNDVSAKYLKTDFAPGGCMIFCRQALKKLNPIPITICEDYEWYCQWQKQKLGKIVAIQEASLVHNIYDNPRIGGFRSAKNILESCELIYKKHGCTFIADENTPRYHCGLTDEEEISDFMIRANRMIDRPVDKSSARKIKDKTKYMTKVRKDKKTIRKLNDLGIVTKVVNVLDKNFTYLISSASDPKILDVCQRSIDKYTPGKTLVATKGQILTTTEAFSWLFNNCETDIGIFIDDDAFLLRDIMPLIDLVRAGKYSLVGFTYKSTDHTKWQYFQPNFLIMDIKRFKKDFGPGKINVNIDLAKTELGAGGTVLSMYGISQQLRGFKTLDLSYKPSEHYKFAGTLWDDKTAYILHLWYGAWRRRGMPEGDLSERDMAAIIDFEKEGLKV